MILLFISGTVLVMISVSGAYDEFQRYFYNLTYDDVKDENPWLRSFFHLQGTQHILAFSNLFVLKNNT